MEEYLVKWGALAIPPYTVGFITGLVIIILLSWWEARRINIPGDSFFGFLALALLGGVAGSRILYVLIYALDYYSENPQQILVLQDGGMNIYGGLLFSFILLFFWSWVNNLPMQKYLDAISPGIALALAFTGTGTVPQGRETLISWPWALQINDQSIHPEQGYFILLICLLFVLLWKRRWEQNYYGEIWSWFLIGLGMIDFTVGFFAEDPVTVGTLGFRQLAGLLCMLLGVFYWHTGKMMIPNQKVSTMNKHKNRFQYTIKLLVLFFFLAGSAIYLHNFLIHEILI